LPHSGSQDDAARRQQRGQPSGAGFARSGGRRSAWRGTGATLATALAALTAGCSAYSVKSHPSPAAEWPDAFPSAPASPTATVEPGAIEPPAVEAWWQAFGDAHLDALIRESLDSALDVRGAFARLEQARARAEQAGSPLAPRVDAFAARSASNVGASSIGDLADDAVDVTELGLLASWELDLFGRLSAIRSAAELDAQAAAEDLAALRLSLSAEVADTFFLALEQVLQLRLLAAQIELDRTLLELTELRFAQGAASAVDVLQQRGQVAATEALVPRAQATRRLAENRLDVLLGRPPDGHDRVQGLAFTELPPLPEPGLPAELLLRRPDLRARLADVSARDHAVGAAVAERFPRLALTGALARQDVEGQRGWAGSLAAELLGPLVDGGQRRAVVAERRAALEESLAALTGAALRAFEEVDGALWAEQRQRDELEVLRRRERILQVNVIEARNRYANGLTDYLSVLVAVNDVQEVQRDVLLRTRELLSRRVELHRALGGALPADATLAGAFDPQALPGTDS